MIFTVCFTGQSVACWNGTKVIPLIKIEMKSKLPVVKQCNFCFCFLWVINSSV